MLLILLVLGTLLIISAFSYANSHIDYTVDEALFAMACNSRGTQFYYHDQNGKRNVSLSRIEALLPSGYQPVEWKEQRLFGMDTHLNCRLQDCTPDLARAFVAIEDKRFFQHNGVDWLRTVKAAANYLLHFDGRFGGSTITQQLIKNISAEDDLTLTRKMREICRAIHLESTHTKEEILELYLNIVPMSQGCIGVSSASDVYFGKPVSDLTLAECASIAAVTNSPARYDPYTQPENHLARRNLILQQMLSNHMITEAAYHDAMAQELCLLPLSAPREPIYDWYTETVISDVVADLMKEKGLSRDVAQKLVYSGGLQIYTQMDQRIQQALTSYFENEGNFPIEFQKGLSCAMVICDPQNGDLLGIVSAIGKKQGNRILNYATVNRAPGSALKPLSVYAPAIEEGLISEGDVYDDVPLSFKKEKNGYAIWPHNSPAIYSGLTDVRDAVAYSKNTVAVRILEKLGTEKSYAYLTGRLGFSSLVRARQTANGETVTDLAPAPLALGQLSDGVSLRDLTNAYGSLENGGIYHDSRSYSLVLDASGQVLLKKEARGQRAFSGETACIMTHLLSGVVDYGTAQSLKLGDLVDTAGKTGTSGNGQDKWFVGYTPYYTAGIWCGYADGQRTVPSSCVGMHLRTWDAVMQNLHRPVLESAVKLRNFRQSSGVVQRAYCKDSGLLPCEGCRKDLRGNRITTGYFKAGEEPRALCNCHVLIRYDRAGGGIACDACPGEQVEEVGLLHLPHRDFPQQIYITDAQYGYHSEEEAVIPGHYQGLSRLSNGHPANDICRLHGGQNDKHRGPFDWLRRYFDVL